MLLYYLFTALAQDNMCSEFGAVQLDGGSSPNVGIVAFCDGSYWHAICRDSWDHYDAAVVCRELGYPADGKSLLTVICYIYKYLV